MDCSLDCFVNYSSILAIFNSQQLTTNPGPPASPSVPFQELRVLRSHDKPLATQENVLPARVCAKQRKGSGWYVYVDKDGNIVSSSEGEDRKQV